MIPMFVVIIAWCTLGEKIDVFEMGILVLSSVALSAIVWSGHESNGEPIDWDEILMYVLLFIQTMGTAAGTVVLRTLKKFDEKAILWYSYWVSLLFTLPIVYTVGNGMSIFLEFNYFDWGLLVGTALAKMAMLVCKIKALQMQSAAKLQILSPV